MDTINITLYLVGTDEEEARGGMPFDSYESADSYRIDFGSDQCKDYKIYTVTARIDFSTMEQID